MAAFNEYPNLFQPIRLGPVKLKNRIVFAPIVPAMAQAGTGEVTDALVAFIAAQARSGVSLVTVGSTPVDFDRARDLLTDMAAIREENLPGLFRVAEAAHRYDARISAELLHAGRNAPADSLQGRRMYVPSLLPGMNPDVYEEIGEPVILEIIESFCRTAKRLQRAEFDMVMVHAAHGNLTSSFFSQLANHRTDKWGGSLENRMRFTLTLLRRLRETVGPKMGLDLRISVHEYADGCPTEDEIIAFLQKAQEYLDSVHFSGGAIYTDELGRYAEPSYMDERNQNVERTAAIRPHLTIPVTVVGNIPDIDDAEEIVRSGKADIVAMARNLIADMELPTKAYRGRAADIRPCLHCNQCSTFPMRGGATIRCAVNPLIGYETILPRVGRANARKKVMIVGGGPGGMTAARTAAGRGHEVVLFEAGERLGGRLHEASSAQPKDYFRRYLEWAVRQTLECGARIEFGVEATPALVEKEAPDALILALGARHIVPRVEGVDLPHVIDVSAADLRRRSIGARVVVIGGGLSGTECAIDLAREGRAVTILDRLAEDELLQGIFPTIRTTLRQLMRERRVEIRYQTVANAVVPGLVRARDLSGGTTEDIPCDTVVLAVGLEPDEARVRRLADIIPETYLVGDCREVRDIFSANHDGFFMALEI